MPQTNMAYKIDEHTHRETFVNFQNYSSEVPTIKSNYITRNLDKMDQSDQLREYVSVFFLFVKYQKEHPPNKS